MSRLMKVNIVVLVVEFEFQATSLLSVEMEYSETGWSVESGVFGLDGSFVMVVGDFAMVLGIMVLVWGWR